MAIDCMLNALLPEIAAWRQDLHQHPELDFDVFRTAAFVADKLRTFGIDEVIEGVGRTGVVGVIRGQKDDSALTIGLRADMDALPILEAGELPYKSSEPGKMHACGHDGHTAMLLGAAQHLAKSRQFNGRAVVIFQPAEELSGGGREMVEDGLMERFNIQQVYGLHNLPGLAVGKFGVRPGPIMAAADIFEIELTGRGGHAALPHLCVDAPLVAAHIIIALQSISARIVDPVQPVVVSVTVVQSEGDTFNVIPQQIKLKGTVRALSADVRDSAEQWVKHIVQSTATIYGASVNIDYVRDYPPTINSAEQAKFAAAVARSVVGNDAVDANIPALMGAEDFSFMLNARPGAFMFIGNGDSASLHNPRYNFNDDALPFGCRYWINLVAHAMPLSG